MNKNNKTLKSYGKTVYSLFKRTTAFSLAFILSIISVNPSMTFGATSVGQQRGVEHLNPDLTPLTGNKQTDIYSTSRIYVNDTPIRLEVSKVKVHVGDHIGSNPKNKDWETQDTMTYQLSGRIDGERAELLQKYGNTGIELAYSNNGAYLGYGWLRGTYERLKDMSENPENYDILSAKLQFNEYDNVFMGYAEITRKLDTADDVNRYVAGSTMTLYESIAIEKQYNKNNDDRFKGVMVERNNDGDVVNVYVKKGYAGERTDFVKEGTDKSLISDDENGKTIDKNYDYKNKTDDVLSGTYIVKTVQRNDTPILYYNLADLHITTNDEYKGTLNQNKKEIDDVFGSERPDKNNRIYGLNKKGNFVDITQRDQRDFSIFAFRDNETVPEFEFVGGDFSKIKYKEGQKTITVSDGTIMYHLDKDGNRDAMVDPFTGIAYIEQKIGNKTKIYVWPVNISYDGSGNTGTGQGNQNGSKTFSKIKTYRIATINSDTEDEYTVGTLDGNNFIHSQNPVIDKHGMVKYYQKSDSTYIKGQEKFDRDGDFIGFEYSDELKDDNNTSYSVNTQKDLYNGDEFSEFNNSNHYQYSDKKAVKITISDNNTPNDFSDDYIVNGKNIMPVPFRDGGANRTYHLAGWMSLANNLFSLEENDNLNARWTLDKMSETEKNMWYSDRPAVGNTKTINVFLNANGGKFNNNTGDAHNTDNKLYRRQGDTYVIENTWITGETTPNDPFDKKTVHTVEQTDNTANDPYSDTTVGGMADMLKRVPVGDYIMEEVIPATGYVSALPVGLTVLENTDIQKAEMVDETTTVIFTKDDTTEKTEYLYDTYKNGNNTPEKEPSGDNIKTKENTSSFSYKTVPGAVLALRAKKNTQETFNKWVDATKNPYITKKTDNDGNRYFTFKTDIPLTIQTLPVGEYTLAEVETPNGFVSAKPQDIKVLNTSDAQIFKMADDHIKLEIEKYMNKGQGKENLPNMYSAELSLINADNGEIVSTWKTDDVSDYMFKGFVESFEKSVKDHKNDDFNSVGFDVERKAKKVSSNENNETWLISDKSRVEIINGVIPNTAPDGFKDAYNHRNMATELNEFKYNIHLTATKKDGNMSNRNWTLKNGSVINTAVIKSNDTDGTGRQGFKFEYKFNKKDDFENINDKYRNVVSYDTVKGTHRFDYLPVGTYILKETKVPEGFVKADDKTIIVKNISDIQYYDLENSSRELVVYKVGANENGEQWVSSLNGKEEFGNTGKVISGAELKLYKVDDFSETKENNFLKNIIPQDAKLIQTWISGTDGYYTQKDYEKENIPTGFKVGDLKPHRISEIANGKYYIVETATPDYMQTVKPVRIEVDDNSTTSGLTKVIKNNEMSGIIKVFKTNIANSGLNNAVFEVKNKDTNTKVGEITTRNGQGSLNIKDIAYFDTDGSLKPYTFTIQEIRPASGYSINDTIYEFQFEKTDHGNIAKAIRVGNAGVDNDGVVTVVDELSSIQIMKNDFNTLNFVDGAKLRVVEAKTDADSSLKPGDVENPDWVWETDTNNPKELNGLTGGKIYVLQERIVPNGYTKADDIYFKVSDDAKKIEKVWYEGKKNQYISFNTDNTGAVESVDFTTRTIVGTKDYIYREDGSLKILSPTTDGLILTQNDVSDGEVVRIEEIITYSDGTTRTIDTKTFRVNFNNLPSITIPAKLAKQVNIDVINDNNEKITSFNSDGLLKTINNSIKKDSQEITVSGNGKNHEPIFANTNKQTVLYSITVEKKGSVVTWTPDSKTYARSTEPTAENVNNVYTWTTSKDNQTIKFSATLNANTTGFVNQIVSVNDKSYSYMNPIAKNEGTLNINKDTSKLVVFNETNGTDISNENYKFNYRITLTGTNGKPLNSYYFYHTKDEIRHRFDANNTDTYFDITLTGDDFVVIEDLPYETNYKVEMINPSADRFISNKLVANGKTKNSNISNELFINTRNLTDERNTFVKNHSYQMIEKTLLSDESELETSKYGFILNENCEMVAIQMKDRPTDVEIEKVEPDGSKVIGSTLSIIDIDGNEIDRWVSDGNAHKLVAKLTDGGTYTLREIKPADGYNFAYDMRFSVSKDGTVDKITMVDEQTELNLTKIDKETKSKLAGATLVILDKDRNVVKAIKKTDEFNVGDELKFVSTVNGTNIKGLLNVEEIYYLREIEPVKGYLIADKDIAIYIKKDGTAVMAKSIAQDENANLSDTDFEKMENKNVALEDKKTELEFVKTDAITGKEVAGATIQIWENKDSDAEKIITTWVSGNDGKYENGDTIRPGYQVGDYKPHVMKGILEAGKTYTLVEYGAPKGYYYTINQDFTVPVSDEQVVKIKMEDEKIKYSFRKTDITGDKEVPGANIKIFDKETGETIDEWTSTNKPHDIEGKFEAGKTYTMRETGAPNGYYYSSDVEFTVPKKNEGPKVVHMVDEKIDVRIKKTDFTTSKEVPGAFMKLIDKESGKVVEEWVSGETEHIVQGTNKLKADHEYILHEENAPNGYYYSTDIEFRIPKLPEGIVRVEMKDEMTNYRFKKTDFVSGKEVEGAHITIYDDKGNVIDEWTSTKEEHEIKGKLVSGQKYIMKETGAPNGYYYTSDIEFTVPKSSHTIQHIEMKDEATKVSFSKTSISGTKELPGATITITDKNGNIIEQWVSDETEHVITGKLNADETYTMNEVGAPNGYYYSESIEFKLPKTPNGNIKVQMKDKPTVYHFKKTDFVSGKEVPGAHISIIDKDGNIVDEWTSTDKEHIIKGKLIVGEKYIMREVGAPNGYAYTEDIEFSVPRMSNKYVEISKQDITNNKEIGGATLRITDKNGTTVDEWVSKENESHIINGLPDGEYTLTEITAPDGYEVAETINFTVKNGRSTSGKIVMKDKPDTGISISKKDITTGEEISGAKLKVVDEYTNQVIDEWVSEYGKTHYIKEIPDGSYKLIETTAPNGYEVAEEIYFKVSNNKTDSHIVMYDKTKDVVISKQDISNGKEISGAKLIVKDEKGKTIESWTSKENESHVIKGLPDGKYTLTEITAPNGYEKAETIKFEVQNGKCVSGKIIMYDKPTDTTHIEMKDKKSYIKFKKTDITTDKELSGAHIQIKDNNENVITEWTSTNKEHILEGVLNVETEYVMHENGAPDGYGYATDIRFKIDRNNVIYVYNKETKKWEKKENSTVKMEDDILKLDIKKVDASNGKLLGNAKMEIKDKNGKVLETWTSDIEKAHEIRKTFANGTKLKVGEIYTLVETEAPNGYLKATEINFTVNKNAQITVVVMEDKPNNPDKPWEKPKIKSSVRFTKYGKTIDVNTNIENLNGLEGATYGIYDSNMNLYKTIITGKGGFIDIPTPKPGVYYLKELKAPEGYMIDRNIYSFTINNNNGVSGTVDVVDYKKPLVKIYKKDIKTKDVLEGAKIEIRNSNGDIVFSERTGTSGTLIFEPYYADTYTISEIEAPNGYVITDAPIVFTVNENGTINGKTEFSFNLLNNKKEHKIGRVTAKYDNKHNSNKHKGDGSGTDKFGRFTRTPKAGDNINLTLLISMLVAGIGLLFVGFKKKKDKK